MESFEDDQTCSNASAARIQLKSIINNYCKEFSKMGSTVNFASYDIDVDKMDDDKVQYFLNNHMKNPQSLKINMAMKTDLPFYQIKFCI